jgi:tetratricopeptide (TPR) repeat protein
MRALISVLLVALVTSGASVIQADTVEEYVKKAEEHQNADRIDEAVKVMEEAVKEHPDSSTVNSYLGLYVGMKAGRVPDFMVAGQLAQRSFGLLDKAVSLDPENPTARFHRGLLYVNVPKFLGKLEQGIGDLETLIEISGKSPDQVSKDTLATAYDFLAQGYMKNEEKQKAKQAWQKVVELAPGSDLAREAEKKSAGIQEAKQTEQKKEEKGEAINPKQKIEKDTDDPAALLKQGKAYTDAGDFEQAEKTLKKLIEIDPDNLDAHKLLAKALGELAAKGYDERIYDDTDLRSNLAFEIAALLDKAVEIAPDDVEARLSRAVMGVEMPFFVGKLDQAMEDLNWVMKSKASDSIKADALYWLGAAHQKKAMTYWIKVVSDHPGSPASRSVFEQMRPSIERLSSSDYKLPALVIDFVLGFRDELPPQTAVWIEGKNGEFIKTVYVSGFSGYAKEQQINLPKWSDSSDFSDVDGVTAASIDVGHHIYVWDLMDRSGKRVAPGEYVVKVEVAYWPSMEYQLASAAIKLGEKETRTVTKEGNLIPYLEAKYRPGNAK